MVNSEKRQRHKDGHRSRVEQARAEQARARRNLTLIIAACVVAVIAVGTVAIVTVGSDDDAVKVASGSTTTLATSDTSGSAGTDTTAPTGEPTECPPADGSASRRTEFTQAPPLCIDPTKNFTALVKTSEGDITIALDGNQSPRSVNNFVVLSRYHYFDGVTFHRIVTGFVNQTGDLTASGSGGPGYDMPEEDPAREYRVGDVAMARALKVSGSQFFFTLDPEPLNGAMEGQKYPILGTVIEGQDIVEKINTFGSPDGAGAPTKKVTIESITITEG